MEIRVLRYFIQIAREGSMTRAAEYLHVSQSALSKQMKELENQLGKKLFRRGSSSVSLTDEGMLLRKRAEDLLAMADKIENEFKALDEITGGDTQQVTERLDRGLLDFAFIVEPPDLSKYNYLEVPEQDTWGILMRKECPLAEKSQIGIDDILPYPVFCSEQAAKVDLPRWCGENIDQLNVMATFNLTGNAAVFAREGLGIAITFDKLVELDAESDLCFRPITPALQTKMYVIWKKYQMFTPVSQLLLNIFKQTLI